MVSRRGLLGGVVALAVGSLAGCGSAQEKLAASAMKAATDVAGVADAELEVTDGANFETLLRGTVSLATDDPDEGLAVFDEAMRSIVMVVHEELDDHAARSLRVGWITGVLADGTEMTPIELGPDVPAETPRRDRITAESFYEKYGLS